MNRIFLKPNSIIRKKGFTLLESLIYLALYSTLFLSMISFVSFINNANARAIEKIDLERELLFASEHITTNFSAGSSIDDANSTYNNANGKISVTGGPTTVTYRLSGGRLVVTINSTDYYLSAAHHTVTALTVTKISNGKSKTTGATISLTIALKSNPSISETLSTLYILKYGQV